MFQPLGEDKPHQNCIVFNMLKSYGREADYINICLNCPLENCVEDNLVSKKDANTLLAFCLQLKYIINLLTEEVNV
jgi:hypothetical protein